MYIAIGTNFSVAMKASGIMNNAFVVAFRGGMVLCFVLAAVLACSRHSSEK
jgi:Na+/H+-translocating membrane pyrophosphatase